MSTEGQDASGGSTSSDKAEMSKGNPENPSSKQQEVVLCSEKAVYVYSLPHILQVSISFIIQAHVCMQLFQLYLCYSLRVPFSGC